MSSHTHSKIVVFGGSGFIGRYVVKRLAALGAVIAVPTRNVEKAKFLRTFGDVGQIAPIACEISNEASLRAVIKNADAVINLPGILFESGKSKFDSVHHKIPMNIAAISRECGVKTLVHISAIGADENSNSAYARSKAKGERAVAREYSGAVILRPSIVFGPEDNFFNLFAGMAQLFHMLPLIGGGQTKFQPVYVGDVADAVVAAIFNDAARGKIYELGGPKIYTFAELMQIMLRQTGQKACLISVPFWWAKVKAAFLQLMPRPLLTIDQVRMLEKDNLVGGSVLKLKDLGITPTALEVILPSYLDRYKTGGRMGNTDQAA
ncbi:MAG: complex I NDUFA9 subunit family protein [Alphaproteobacteria bacterium]|nr:MAG: complex I NDUFA9 subunit family protein [Alphaproteobacteria bacterium]